MTSEQDISFLAQLNENLGIVRRVCRTYFPHEPAEREEAFQDIMYQLWRSHLQFKGDSKFSTWMYRVALNTVLGRIRRSARRPQEQALTEEVSHALDISESSERQEDIRQLYRAIDTLTDIDKAIVLLHLEDRDYEEIASITGLSRTNVSVRLVRIKRTLKAVLERTP
jgi:RNA polymerase sigma factor (sigma-70 family)